jgi:CRP/FNR family transcriptional regulator, anaerobic regulatory protein
VTTTSLQRPETARLSHPYPSDTATSDGIPPALAAQGALMRIRRGQSLPLTLDGSGIVFVVRSGMLILRVMLSTDQRQVVTVLFPGDVFRSSFAPPQAAAHLSGVSAGEVLRYRLTTFNALAADDPAIARYYDDAVARQTARQSIHMAAVGRMDCQQRLATYLMELALRTGAPAASGGVMFEMPLSRTDMADYLGLNADTLSRTISRLRASGLLSHPERHKGLVRDLGALAALTPAAPALRALCQA